MLLAQTLESIIQKIETEILNPFFLVLMAAATLVFIWGIIQMMASGDDSGAKEDGRRHMLWGIVGLVIMAGAWGIINLIASFWKT